MTDPLGITLDEISNEPIASVPFIQPLHRDCLRNKVNDFMLVLDPSMSASVVLKDLVAVKVTGEEMMPTISPGDTAIFTIADKAVNDAGVFMFQTHIGVAVGRVVFSKFSGDVTIKTHYPHYKDKEMVDLG